MKFLVEITPGASTRWLTDDATLSKAILQFVRGAAYANTEGPIPVTTVSVLPAGPVPAERSVATPVFESSGAAQISSGAPCGAPLPTPTTARRESSKGGAR